MLSKSCVTFTNLKMVEKKLGILSDDLVDVGAVRGLFMFGSYYLQQQKKNPRTASTIN